MLFDSFTEQDPVDDYCAVCREMGDADCANCDRNIEVVDV